jgi:P2 family phage contractile tail tube protein
MATINQTLVNYKMYLAGTGVEGTVDITQPNIQKMTAEISGAGIAGSVDEPILGHTQDFTGTVKFRVVQGDVRQLLSQNYQQLEFWGAIQVLDTSTGELVAKQHKVIWQARNKSDNMGTFTVGAVQGRELEFTIRAIKEYYDNELIREIDKYNNIDSNGETDFLADVRSAIGM